MRKIITWQAFLFHGVSIMIFFVLSFFFFSPFVQGKLSFIWDTREFGFINLHLVTRALSEGYFPLWNEYNFSGYPFAGDIESGMFYPVNWLFAWIFGAVDFGELSYYFIFHFFLGAVFAYLLSYKLTKNVWASFAGGIAYAYSGYALGHISHLGQLVMYMWVPLVFWAYIVLLERISKKSDLLRQWLFFIFLAGFSLGITLLVGHSNTTIYLLLGLVILTILEILMILISAAGRQKFYRAFKVGVASFLATVFAFMISAVLLLPVSEFAAQSNRIALIYEQQSEGWSLNPLNLIGLIDPDYNHVLSYNPMDDFDGSVDITQNYFFIGWLPLIFIVFALFSRNKYKWFFVVFGVICLLAAFGKYTPVNLLLFKYFPGFDRARMAVQIMGMVFLAASALTAMGMARFLEFFEKKRRLIFGIFFGVIFCVVIVVNIFYFSYDKRFYSEKVNPGAVFNTSEDGALISGLSAVGKRGDIELSPFRISDEKNFLMQNKWEFYGLENVWGNGGIKIKKYNDLFKRVDRTHWVPISDALYDFLGVKYLFTDRDLKGANFQKEKIAGVDVYRNLDVLPRAYLVKDFIIEEDENEQLKLISDGKIDFENEVLLDGKLEYLGKSSVKSSGSSAMVVLDRKSDYLEFKTVSVEDSILVMSELNFPRWKLFVDGMEEEYVTANYAFRAVPLKAGEHIVEFKYQPSSVRIGAFVSVFSLILFIMSAFWQFIGKKRG